MRLVVCDVRDRERIEPELNGARVVVHMACDNLRASLGNPERSHDVNGTGSLVTALASVEAGVERFVYVSSSEAYGSAVAGRWTRTHPLRPTTVYGAAKAAGELYAQSCMRAYGLPVSVVRPFNSYGPRSHAEGTSAEVVPKFATRILAGLPPVVFGDGSQTRDFTWVEETARGSSRRPSVMPWSATRSTWPRPRRQHPGDLRPPPRHPRCKRSPARVVEATSRRRGSPLRGHVEGASCSDFAPRSAFVKGSSATSPRSRESGMRLRSGEASQSGIGRREASAPIRLPPFMAP